MHTLADTLCTHCEAAGLELTGASQAVCRYCGTPNVLEGVVCAHCEAVNPAGQTACGNCRRALYAPCANCGQSNWAGAEACRACGARLSPLDHLSTRFGPDPSARLTAQQRSAQRLKEQEAQAGERRLADLNALEARRLADLRAARERQAAQQRVLLIGTGVVVLVILAAVLVSALLAGMR